MEVVNTRYMYLVWFGMLCSVLWGCSSLSVVPPKQDAHPSAPGDAIRGYYHAWWTIIPVPTETVMQMLPGDNFKLADVPIKDFPADHHPVFLEIGFEKDCGPINLKPFWMDFEEFKYDIPYVIALQDNVMDPRMSAADDIPAADVGPLIYKSVIYLPTLVLSESARLTYNLNASKADSIEMTDTSYNIRKGQDLKFNAEFESDGDWETGNTPRFAILEDVVSQTWFGRLQNHIKSCGINSYDLDNIKFRSVVGTITADEGIVSPAFPSDTIKVASLNQVSYGAVEVYVNFTISAAFDCLP